MTETAVAAKIIGYWSARGYRVMVALHNVVAERYESQRQAHRITAVRSDLVNGLPRDWAVDVQSDLAVRAR